MGSYSYGCAMGADYVDCKHRAVQRITKRRKEVKRQAVKMLGNKCSQCGFDDLRALEIDHINGGGNEHRRKRGAWGVYYDVLHSEGKGYRLLCANCHSIETSERRQKLSLV